MSPFAGEEMRLRGQVRCLRWEKPKAGSQSPSSCRDGLHLGVDCVMEMGCGAWGLRAQLLLPGCQEVNTALPHTQGAEPVLASVLL